MRPNTIKTRAPVVIYEILLSNLLKGDEWRSTCAASVKGSYKGCQENLNNDKNEYNHADVGLSIDAWMFSGSLL